MDVSDLLLIRCGFFWRSDQLQNSSVGVRLTIKPKYFSKYDPNHSPVALEGSSDSIIFSLNRCCSCLNQEREKDRLQQSISVDQ